MIKTVKKYIPKQLKNELKKRFRLGPYPNWKAITGRDPELWREAVQKAKGGKKILMATSVGAHRGGNIIESMLSVALTLRGAEVHALYCDKVLPGCLGPEYGLINNLQKFAEGGPQKNGTCAACFPYARQMYDDLGLTLNLYSQWLTSNDKTAIDRIARDTPFDQIGAYKQDGLPVGEHAIAGALRFYCTGDLANQEFADTILRRYFKAALITQSVMKRLIEAQRYEASVFFHGIYIPHGVLGMVARDNNVRVVNWNTAYRSRRFIFTHHDTYHHMLMNEPIANWKQFDFTPAMENQVMEYLYSREKGTRDWQQFNEGADPSLEAAVQELHIDLNKPTIGLLPNVVWDAQLHYPANAFSNLIEWALKTVEYFIKRPELQLIVRAHPAEIKRFSKSRQPLIAEIQKAYPQLPGNIFLVPPESKISTYTLMQACNAVLVYGTKTGVELTARGIPVIVAGEAWIRNKGLTLDASTREEYFKLLDRLPLKSRMDPESVREARKYAYHFFYRRGIFLPIVQKSRDNMAFTLGINRITELLPGKCAGLDLICDGILTGKEFVYPAEQWPHEDE